MYNILYINVQQVLLLFNLGLSLCLYIYGAMDMSLGREIQLRWISKHSAG